MYRPPENANRVQAIRSIFENKEATPSPPKLITKSKTELEIRYSRCHENLNRQLSDPSKRNIKRTPAFRLDKNSIAEKNSSRYQSRVKHDCDKAKSKCLEDETLGSRNQSNTSEMSSTNEVESARNISFLYAEPIPKALRVKKCDTTPKSGEDAVCLTDTLKSALRKPLPAGPAPKKPPRTFLHSPQTPKGLPPSTNKQFTDILNRKLQKTPARGKGDPKYMLDKLENMLRSGSSRIRKAGKTDTSGEDSDDCCSKTARLPFNASNTLPNNSLFNLNCLNALGCTASTYERIKQPNSSFFVDCQKEEPVYAEPFQFRENVKSGGTAKQKDRKKAKEQRNSLYYMVRN